MIYPNSNLPTVSQPWGRAIQKGIEALEATVKSNDINNKARDTQLQNSYKLLDDTVEEVKDALAAVGIATTTANTANSTANGIVAGTTSISGAGITTGTLSASKITSGTLNASLVTVTNLNANNITTGSLSGDRITGGTITGTTVQTSSSGSRVVLSGNDNQLQFYYNGSPAGNIEGWTKDGSPVINVNGTTVVDGTLFGNQIVSSGYVYGTTGFFSLISAPQIDTDYVGTINLNATGSSTTTGIVNTGGISSTGGISTDGGLVRTAYSGGGTSGASFNDNGNLIRTASSERYKQDIQDVEYDYSSVIALQPKSFRLKSEAAENQNSIIYPGFIAEELAGTPLDIFVRYETLPDGTKRPDGIHYAELTSALVSAIKHQDGLIQSLTSRIEALESKV